jgi:hypothetical protein
MAFITRTYTGYVYNVEQDAINAKQLAKEYKGFPILITDETYYWVKYFKAPLDDFWYIIYVDELDQVLGQPIEFEVRFPVEDPI